jgi:hypothetical protein
MGVQKLDILRRIFFNVVWRELSTILGFRYQVSGIAVLMIGILKFYSTICNSSSYK